MVGSILGLFTPLTIWLQGQEELDSKFVDLLNLYLLAGFIAEGVVLFFLSNIIQDRRDVRNDRKDHTKDLYEIYKRIAEVGFTEEKDKLTRTYPSELTDHNYTSLEKIFEDSNPFPRISEKYLYLYNEYEYFDFAIEHLKHKKYKNIFQCWEKSNKLIDEYNDSPKFMEYLLKKIRKSMSESFPQFEEKKGSMFPDQFYKIKSVTDYIMNKIEYIQDYPAETIFNDLIIDRLGSEQSCICAKGSSIQSQLASTNKTNLDLEKYKKILELIMKDKKFRDLLDTNNKKRLEIIEEQEQFKKELQSLITRLKAGELIEGTCPIGY